MIELLETPAERPVAPRAPLPRLGVGVLYNPALPGFLRSDLDALDYLEVIPEMFWTDRGIGSGVQGAERFVELDASVRAATRPGD